jgi:hypothetical protein
LLHRALISFVPCVGIDQGCILVWTSRRCRWREELGHGAPELRHGAASGSGVLPKSLRPARLQPQPWLLPAVEDHVQAPPPSLAVAAHLDVASAPNPHSRPEMVRGRRPSATKSSSIWTET